MTSSSGSARNEAKRRGAIARRVVPASSARLPDVPRRRAPCAAVLARRPLPGPLAATVGRDAGSTLRQRADASPRARQRPAGSGVGGADGGAGGLSCPRSTSEMGSTQRLPKTIANLRGHVRSALPGGYSGAVGARSAPTSRQQTLARRCVRMRPTLLGVQAYTGIFWSSSSRSPRRNVAARRCRDVASVMPS